MSAVINLIEPTLSSQAGHCYSFVSALCAASEGDVTLRLWVDRAANVHFSAQHVRVKPWFFRKIRRAQSVYCYRSLLKTDEKIFVSTAGHFDLLALNWAARGVIPPNKVYLYFHWVNLSESKKASLHTLAKQQPNLVILAPTESVVQIFRQAGFAQVKVVPYPVLPTQTASTSHPFRYLLYAGAARRDKGFAELVELVAYLKQQQIEVPLMVQISPEHYGKYDANIQADIQRLQSLAYPQIHYQSETLSMDDYRRQFDGSICIQLYNQQDFSDRISGVTLDAFAAGAPIVTVGHTWMARMAEKFSAGVCVQDCAPASVWQAVGQILNNYAVYAEHALHAGQVLQQENSAGLLYQTLVR